MRDRFGREITYLRVSVTDRCNLRCVYCMPPEGVKPKSHREILSFEEIEGVIRAAVGMGIRNVRLTGGEPLVRQGLVGLVEKIARIPGIEDIAMTTNAILLEDHAQVLKDAGLRRVNVSLDTLVPERYRQITRGGDIDKVLRGIRKSMESGLKPLKINTVVVQGFNDDEIEPLARLTLENDIHVRFIELMTVGESGHWPSSAYMPSADLQQRLPGLVPAPPPSVGGKNAGHGPAVYYRLPGAQGTVGFITPVSNRFCSQCNRLRLTADGYLRPCLLNRNEFSIRDALRSGATTSEIQRLIKMAIDAKPEQQELQQTGVPLADGGPECRLDGGDASGQVAATMTGSGRNRFMSQIGG